MTNEQVLEVVKKALELGDARIKIAYFNQTTKDAFKQVETLSVLMNTDIQNHLEDDNWLVTEGRNLSVVSYVRIKKNERSCYANEVNERNISNKKENV